MGDRIVGSHFNPSGKPKRGYSSESDARREAGRFGMTYYRCDVCNKFHLARDSGGRRRPTFGEK